MPSSLIYRSAAIYEAVMIVLYGRHYGARYRAISDLIEDNTGVLDLCCGPAVLYRRYLRHKGVRYMGLDISAPFIDKLRDAGIEGRVWNVRSSEPLPPADYVVIQGSLHQFLPEPHQLMSRMLNAARKRVIISEPVRNIATSRLPFLPALGRRMTDPGDGPSLHRFTERSLSLFLEPYAGQIQDIFSIPGGREKVYVLDPAPRRSAVPKAYDDGSFASDHCEKTF